MQLDPIAASTRTQPGLCSTCNNGGDCGYRAARGFDAIDCGMFDDYVALARPTTPTLFTATRQILGLCGDCAERDGCALSAVSGPVVYCEEYR